MSPQSISVLRQNTDHTGWYGCCPILRGTKQCLSRSSVWSLGPLRKLALVYLCVPSSIWYWKKYSYILARAFYEYHGIESGGGGCFRGKTSFIVVWGRIAPFNAPLLISILEQWVYHRSIRKWWLAPARHTTTGTRKDVTTLQNSNSNSTNTSQTSLNDGISVGLLTICNVVMTVLVSFSSAMAILVLCVYASCLGS